MQNLKNDAKKIVCDDLRDYWKMFKMPARASSLRIRVSRVLSKIEGRITLIDLLREMDDEGLLKLLITESMTRFCVPIDFWNGMTHKEQYDYVRKLDPSTTKRFDQIERSEQKIPSSNFFSEKETF